MLQDTKKRVDVGVIGNPSTGDILYDGGVKLNTVIDALYNTFGDYRLYSSASEGADSQILHATGFYQKLSRQYYAGNPVDIGSMHDADTTSGALTMTLPNAKLGEGCVFINSNGSISPSNPLIIRPQSGETILGTSGNLTITSPYSRIIVWCTKADGNQKYWEYGITPLFGDSMMPVEKTILATATPTNIRIAGKNEYVAIKLLVAAKNNAGTAFKTAETFIAIDTIKNEVINTEYAVLKNTDSELYDIRFFIGAGDNVYAEVKSLSGQLRFSIKAIDTVKIGATS
ncbi:baseplate protein [Aeromonas phage avDM5]|uniref:Baseplate protein n=1 Tax=Aeromonas phage vB_AehM_DM2 TaxID=2973716 RepID=A0AA94YK05_9CAUD|nr:baseplate protein [Aeromonas phage avDM5]UYD60571.1 baseplate protein [Aeromonas phage avDM2]UYD60837.1 baseplate protein [Aeromonas phage avDM2]